MKATLLRGGIFFSIVTAFFAFQTPQASITGKVSPGDGAESVWAISPTDSVKAMINAGTFTMQVKPGTYKVMVDAKDPYRDVLLDNVIVADGHPADVGEIVLQK